MDEPAGEVQFRCKLCQFTGSDKTEIAEHFLSEHIEVEYITPTKKGKIDKEKKEKLLNEKEKEGNDNFSEKSPSKKRGRPRGKTSSSVKSPKIAFSPEPATSQDDAGHLGRGMRKRKKKLSLDEVNSEDVDDDDDDNGDDVDGDDDHDDEDILDDEEHDNDSEFEDEATGEQILNEANKNMIKIKPLEFKPRRRGRPRKNERRSHRKRDRNWSTVDDVTPKNEERVKLNLVVPMKVFKKILRDRADEWQKTYDDEHSLNLFRCEVERCRGMGMPEAEFDVHMKCHVSNMEGFRCFICQFMCLHWRNMRHHYCKVHDQMLSKVTCDFEGCQKEFPKYGALRTHVTISHIKPDLVTKLSTSTSDLSEFSSYLDNVKIKKVGKEDHEEDDEDDGEEPRKQRGRPPKRKRPVGRPPKDTEGYNRRQNLQRRVHGEDREKFQRRLVAFVCEVCSAKFNEEEKLMEHSLRHYRNDDDQINCTECEGFVTGEESSLRIHMSEEHKRLLQLHRCDKCNFSSNRFHDLKKHNIVHTGAKNFMCDKCGKCTTTPYNLKVHYRRMHASDEEKKIKCISCEYRCADKAVLKVTFPLTYFPDLLY